MTRENFMPMSWSSIRRSSGYPLKEVWS